MQQKRSNARHERQQHADKMQKEGCDMDGDLLRSLQKQSADALEQAIAQLLMFVNLLHAFRFILSSAIIARK